MSSASPTAVLALVCWAASLLWQGPALSPAPLVGCDERESFPCEVVPVQCGCDCHFNVSSDGVDKEAPGAITAFKVWALWIVVEALAACCIVLVSCLCYVSRARHACSDKGERGGQLARAAVTPPITRRGLVIRRGDAASRAEGCGPQREL